MRCSVSAGLSLVLPVLFEVGFLPVLPVLSVLLSCRDSVL